MFSVDCPSCKATYKLDENRIPTAGMNMRCPKCSTSFRVHKPGSNDDLDLPAIADKPSFTAPEHDEASWADLPSVTAASASHQALSSTATAQPSGISPRSGIPLFDDDMLPAPRAEAKRAAPSAIPFTPSAPSEPSSFVADLDLPMPHSQRFHAAEEDFADLPSPFSEFVSSTPTPASTRSEAPFPIELEEKPDEQELPMPAPPRTLLPASHFTGPSRGGALLDDDETDLPSLRPPVPAAAQRPSMPVQQALSHTHNLPGVRNDLPAAPQAGQKRNFGELDLPLASLLEHALPKASSSEQALPAVLRASTATPPQQVDEFELSPFDDIPPGPEHAAEAATAAAHTFGELNLEDLSAPEPGRAPGQKPLPGPSAVPHWGERVLSDEEGMEFGELPQEQPPAAGGASAHSTSSIAATIPHPSVATTTVPRIASSRATEREAGTAKPKRKALLAMLGFASVGALGASLALTPYGAFGFNAFYDLYTKKENAALFSTTLQQAQNALTADTGEAKNRAVALFQAAHARAPRAQDIAAYTAFTEYLLELRFGHDSALDAQAQMLFSEVRLHESTHALELARAAQEAASAQGLARGKNRAEALVQSSPHDRDALVLAGEINLLAKDGAQASTYWAKLSTLENSARAAYGQARAALLQGDAKAAEAHAKQALSLSAEHAGARLLLARLAWGSAHDEATTSRLVNEVLRDATIRASASPSELVDAYSLEGQVHLIHSQVSSAESSFQEALKVDPKAALALSGLGEGFYRAGRYSEALARFESAMESDPEALEPKIGVAKTKLALERLQEAKDLLLGLAQKSPNQPPRAKSEVLSWLGRTNEALGDKTAAEANYNEAIKSAGISSEIVDTYAALARLLLGLGRPAEAQMQLQEAKAKLPSSTSLFKALGDLALEQGRYEEAEQNYNAALALSSPTAPDLNLLFKLGTTLRHMGKYKEAAATLDKVAEADKDYPGLMLERAVLYEASGESSRALDLYRAALAKAPNDVDLMLRVAAALIAVEQPEQAGQAEELLRKVLAQRQNSAEANHFLGRALLLKGSNLAEALTYFRRATELDPNRAEHFLYLGRAANEVDNQALASTALDRALELDKSLADAYWQRGVLRRRQRAVLDAEKDLLKALDLRPSRYEAYATLAEVYEDQQKWAEAETAWQKAIAHDANNALWQFRLGKLLSQNNGRALEHLTAAVSLTVQLPAPPPWFAEACLLLADAERAAGKKANAIEHYRRFLSLAPLDSPYRTDATKALAALGVRE